MAEKVLLVQRDFGDRGNRKHARLKYTIDDRSLGWFKEELQRLGWPLEPERPYRFEHRGDRFGWVQGTNGFWHLTLFIASGRIRDWEGYPLMSGLREIARQHGGELRLTPNQNLIIANVARGKAGGRSSELVAKHQLNDGRRQSALRRNALACVALPMCGLAMAESERYLPEFLEKLEALAREAGLTEDEIVVQHDGLSQRLRPALCGRDRPGGQGGWQIQPLSWGRFSGPAAE